MTAILSALNGIIKGIGKGIGIVNKFKPIADLTGNILNSTGLGRKMFGTKNWARGYRVYNNVSNWIIGRKMFGTKNWARGYRVYNNVSNWISGDGTKAVNNAQNSLNRLNSLHH